MSAERAVAAIEHERWHQGKGQHHQNDERLGIHPDRFIEDRRISIKGRMQALDTMRDQLLCEGTPVLVVKM